MPRPVGPRQRRAQWLRYKPGLRLLSTAIVNKLSHRTAMSRGAADGRKDRAFRGFPPHLSHNVATFWVKDMQCFVDCQPSAALGHSRDGEPDEVVMALRLMR